MVIFDNYPNIEEASIIAGKLEDSGIPCYISDDNNLYVPVFGGVTIYVREEDLERAKQIVAAEPNS